MNVPTPNRGRRTAIPRPRATGGRWLNLADRGFQRMLDRVDRGLATGAIEATLPDGRTRLLGGRADGPVAVVTLHSWRAMLRLASGGSAGWYAAWARGEWSSPDPVPLFDLFMHNRATLGATARAKGWVRLLQRVAHALNRNDRRRARANIAFHYDLGNDFYAAWLDETMSYSSGLFDGPETTLEQAQHAKMDALIDRAAVSAGDEVLEIGCGWGALATRVAERGVRVTALTLSGEQKHAAEARAAAAGVAGDVDVRLSDYRDVAGTYDAILSVEMIEAVGQAYWGTYLDTIAARLRPGGRAAIQYIAIADDVFDAYSRGVDFIQRHVFPGGMLVSESRLRTLAGARGLRWEAPLHFGLDYARTLAAWRARFDRALDEGRLPRDFDRSFVDLWRYYLMYCEGGFRGGGIDVAQVTLVKG